MRTFFASARAQRSLRLLFTSRHSVLPALRQTARGRPKSVATQAVALGCGSILIGVAVAMLVQADLGLAPYDVLSSGIARQVEISLGQAGWLVAAVLFAVAAVLGRRPSPWGIGYILANGIAIDATAALLVAPTSIAGRLVYVMAAVAVMATGVNLVLASGTTGGPFELLMAAGQDRGVSPTLVRYVLDISVLLGGLALGGSFGVATVLYAALMGVTLQVTRQAFVDYQNGRNARKSVARVGDFVS